MMILEAGWYWCSDIGRFAFPW